ncbi:hypothetical protein M218_06775 [Burkholderia pseudomallei MSHR338]|uniref:Uncharacterized protein n=4 Tax=pseudomallei group TaxID=111527 RepID=Q3JTZ3_BURP1|nr:hypothetical protein BURPS1710b_1556 [Burkholderia pseudomallei 1710b]ABM49803.1 conserved hypothetical protein [Burkholderia mallei SAVP1]ABN03807.1 hypothetical protein BMA10229_A0640 [Burkholderia mallei NCTC 10229]ABN90860.1 conserved hypothetical protein [Burkholderia pseudomallei 1106a]ABO05536.1 conserved hypothetical protein [Burkholderia mallei NCTC 10247]ACQ97481.1 conserved hypothetical protein [Burkholderia pseudomallei MSHR346]EBA44912.1 hypothetical protein BURPS305_0330 [Bur
MRFIPRSGPSALHATPDSPPALGEPRAGDPAVRRRPIVERP